MKNKWIKLSDLVALDDNQLCLFAQFDDKQSSDSLVLTTDYMTWAEIKTFRAFELANYYTHFMMIDRPNRENND